MPLPCAIQTRPIITPIAPTMVSSVFMLDLAWEAGARSGFAEEIAVLAAELPPVVQQEPGADEHDQAEGDHQRAIDRPDTEFVHEAGGRQPDEAGAVGDPCEARGDDHHAGGKQPYANSVQPVLLPWSKLSQPL